MNSNSLQELEHYRRLEELFEEAESLPDSELTCFLEQLAAKDSGIAQELVIYLEEARQAEMFFERSAPPVSVPVGDEAETKSDKNNLGPKALKKKAGCPKRLGPTGFWRNLAKARWVPSTSSTNRHRPIADWHSS